MKRRICIGILLSAVLASFAVAEGLEAIVAKNLEARGGLDKIRSVDSVRLSGTMTMGGQMEAPFTWQWKRPDKLRLEFKFQGMTGIQAFDGETGWRVMPFGGQTDPEEVSEDERKLFEEQADFDGPLIDSEKKGYTVEYLGAEEVEGTEAHKLKLTKGDNVTYLYLDAEYFLEIKSEAKRTVRGQEVEIETAVGDYKDVEGLLIAHSIESKPKGASQGQTITFEKIELNVELDDSQFVMPEVEEAEAEPESEE